MFVTVSPDISVGNSELFYNVIKLSAEELGAFRIVVNVHDSADKFSVRLLQTVQEDVIGDFFIVDVDKADIAIPAYFRL